MHTHNNIRTRIKKQGPTRTVTTKVFKKHGSPPIASTNKLYLRQMSVMKPVLLLNIPSPLHYDVTPPPKSPLSLPSSPPPSSPSRLLDVDPERHYIPGYQGHIAYSTNNTGLLEAQEAVRMGQEALQRWNVAQSQMDKANQQSISQTPSSSRNSSITTPSIPSLHDDFDTQNVPSRSHSIPKITTNALGDLELSSNISPIKSTHNAAKNESKYLYNHGSFDNDKNTNFINQSNGRIGSPPHRQFGSQPSVSPSKLSKSSTSLAPSTSSTKSISSSEHFSDQNAAPIRPLRPPSIPSLDTAILYPQTTRNFTDSDIETDFSRTSHISSTQADHIDSLRRNQRFQIQELDGSSRSTQHFQQPHQSRGDATLGTIGNQFTRVKPFIHRFLTQPYGDQFKTQSVEYDTRGKVILDSQQQHLQHLQLQQPQQPQQSQQPQQPQPSQQPQQHQQYQRTKSSFSTYPKLSQNFHHESDFFKSQQHAPLSIVRVNARPQSSTSLPKEIIDSIHDDHGHGHNLQNANRKYFNQPLPSSLPSESKPKVPSQYFHDHGDDDQDLISTLDLFTPPSARKQTHTHNKLDSFRDIQQQSKRVNKYDNLQSKTIQSLNNNNNNSTTQNLQELESMSYFPKPILNETLFGGMRKDFSKHSIQNQKERQHDPSRGQQYIDTDYDADGVHHLSHRISDMIEQDLVSSTEFLPSAASTATPLTTKSTTQSTQSIPTITTVDQNTSQVSNSFKSSTPTFFDERSNNNFLTTNFPPISLIDEDPTSTGTRDKKQFPSTSSTNNV